MAKSQRPSSKQSSKAKDSSVRDSAGSRSAKGAFIGGSASKVAREANTGRLVEKGFRAVVSQPANASEAGRRAERTFTAGVRRELRNAQLHGVAVTVQGRDGGLVRGVPSQRGRTFVIQEEAALLARESNKATTKRDSGHNGPR